MRDSNILKGKDINYNKKLQTNVLQIIIFLWNFIHEKLHRVVFWGYFWVYTQDYTTGSDQGTIFDTKDQVLLR